MVTNNSCDYSPVQYDVQLGGANGTLVSLTNGASTTVLTSNGVAANPSWQSISALGAIKQIDGDTGSMTPTAGVVTISGGTTGLTTTASASTMDLTGILILANGGTSAALTASNGGIFYSTASAGAILAGTATARQVLQSGANTTPAWSTATYPATTTINDILYSSSNNVVGQITASNNGVLISGTTGIPSWLANSGTPGFVLTANSGLPPSWQSVTAEGAITTIDGDSGSMTPTSGTVTISGGTTGLTTSASDSTMNLTGTLNVGHGGTGATTLTGVLIGNGTSPVTGNAVTQYDVLLGGASNAIVSLTPGTSTTVLRSQGASANPAYSTNFKVSNTDVMTNTGQPCFRAYLSTSKTNAVGGGSVYQVIFDTIVTNQTSSYNGSTGFFTIPVNGTYLFCFTASISNLNAAFTNGLWQLFGDGGEYCRFFEINPYVTQDVTGNCNLSGSTVISLTVGDEIGCHLIISGGTPTGTVNSGFAVTHFSGFLIC